MRFKASQIIGLIFASLLVGFALDAFGISPIGFWHSLWNSVSAAALWVWDRGNSLFGYVLTGAIIVIPIYILAQIAKNRRR